MIDALHDGVNALVLDTQASDHLLRVALQGVQAQARSGDAPVPTIVAGALAPGLARLALETRCLAFPLPLAKPEIDFVLQEASRLAHAHAENSLACARRWSQGPLGAWVSDALNLALTPRQRVIVALAVLGIDRSRISQALGIEVRTVDFHIGGVLAETARTTLEDLVAPLRSQLNARNDLRPPALDTRTPRMGVPAADGGDSPQR